MLEICCCRSVREPFHRKSIEPTHPRAPRTQPGTEIQSVKSVQVMALTSPRGIEKHSNTLRPDERRLEIRLKCRQFTALVYSTHGLFDSASSTSTQSPDIG